MKWDPDRQGTQKSYKNDCLWKTGSHRIRPQTVCLCRVFTPPGHGHLECLSQSTQESNTLDHKLHFILSVKIRSKGFESNKRYTHDWTHTCCYCASHRRKLSENNCNPVLRIPPGILFKEPLGSGLKYSICRTMMTLKPKHALEYISVGNEKKYNKHH